MPDPCIRYRPLGHQPSGVFTALDLGPQCLAPGLHPPGCADCLCSCHTSATECDWQSCWDRHARVECKGCAPAVAEHGRLCHRDWWLLSDLLGAREQPEGPHGITWIYGWLGENVRPSMAAKSGASGGIDAPAAANLGVIDLRVEIAKKLDDHVTEAAGRLGRVGPQRRTVYSLVSWLHAQLEPVCALDMVEGLWSDVTDWAINAHLLAPWRGRPRILEGVPCPWCDKPGSLRIHSGEIDVKCVSCGAFIESDRYKMWTEYLAKSARDIRATQAESQAS